MKKKWIKAKRIVGFSFVDIPDVGRGEKTKQKKNWHHRRLQQLVFDVTIMEHNTILILLNFQLLFFFFLAFF